MSRSTLKIAFHGSNAANFRSGFETLLQPGHQLVNLSDNLNLPGELAHFESADVLVGIRLDAQLPRPLRARLYHAPAAGTDGIDPFRLPAGCVLCNCYGHENAIAEYVLAAMLQRHVPLAQADADLRRGRWTYWAGRPTALRSELGARTLGLLGYGHIAKAIAVRAKAFGMRVHVANRSAVCSPLVDHAYALRELTDFMGSADTVVVSLPLTNDTRGLVDASALAAMRSDGVLINVGRGPVVEEQALHDALRLRRIGGAVIDTWYQYPSAGLPECAPSKLDFAALDNVTLTPHMSGWTEGMILRRQQTMADNIARLETGQPLENVVLSADVR